MSQTNQLASTSVSNAASSSAIKVFTAVATTADTISNAVNSVGNLFEELNARSSARLQNVQLELNANGDTRRKEILIEAAIRQRAVLSQLSSDQALATIYKELADKYLA